MLTSSEVQIAALTIVITLVILKVFQYVTNITRSPPGPWGYPVIGNLHLLKDDPNNAIQQLRQKFGNLFVLRLGSRSAVVISGREAITQALKEKGGAFSDRPDFYTLTALSDVPSLTVGGFSEEYIRHRKVAVKILSTFTNARTNPMNDIIQREVDSFLETVESKNGQSFDPSDDIILTAGGIIYQICYGHQENIRENKDFIDYILQSLDITDILAAGNPVDVFPWLRFIFPNKVARAVEILQKSLKLRANKVEEHRATFNKFHLRDITDAVLEVMNSDNDGHNLIGKRRLLTTIDDFFNGGFGTLSITMKWMMLLMALYPDVQTKVQKEIDDVVGMSRRPELSDRSMMAFTESTIHEIMRFKTIAPLSLPHCATADTEFRGYTIKKGTVVFVNLHSMSHDEVVWGDPHVFRPERFIDDSGQIKRPLLEEFLPFSTGRRKCPGQSLARMELFLFFTCLLQRCSIVKQSGVYDMTPSTGFLQSPRPFEVKIIMRS